jgi:glycine/D-amino acid oxidase-like deaminating enzyme
VTTRMRNKAERIVIVGGGVSGLSIAMRLCEAGLRVTLLDSRSLGQGPSTKNQGWLYSGAWFARRQPSLARACYQSLEQTIQLCPDALEPTTSPMIYLMSSPATAASKWTNAWDAARIPYQALPISEAAKETGIRQTLIRQAYRLPDRAIKTDVLLEFLTAEAERLGVEVRTETAVARLLKDGNKVLGVVTSKGEEIPGQLVILAANVGGVELWPTSSKPGEQTEFTRVGLKTHCLTIQPEIGRTPFCIVDLEGLNHLPHEGRSVIGSSRWLLATDTRDSGVNPDEIDRLRTLLATCYPQFEATNHEVVEWAGVTVQAMHFDQVEPGLAPMPTVIDHECEPPRLSNLLSVFPGRATLWPQLAEMTQITVLEKIRLKGPEANQSSRTLADRVG